MKMRLFAIAILSCLVCVPAEAHDIYTGVHGKNGQLCCGGSDCAATVYKLVRGSYSFMTRGKQWVEIPTDRITFLPVPGDTDNGDEAHHAHMCYRAAVDSDRLGPAAENVFGDIFFYCAFIPPGSI